MDKRKFLIGDTVYVKPTAYKGLVATVTSYRDSTTIYKGRGPLYGVDFKTLPFPGTMVPLPFPGTMVPFAGYQFYEYELFACNYLCICHNTDTPTPECLECVTKRFP